MTSHGYSLRKRQINELRLVFQGSELPFRRGVASRANGQALLGSEQGGDNCGAPHDPRPARGASSMFDRRLQERARHGEKASLRDEKVVQPRLSSERPAGPRSSPFKIAWLESINHTRCGFAM